MPSTLQATFYLIWWISVYRRTVTYYFIHLLQEQNSKENQQHCLHISMKLTFISLHSSILWPPTHLLRLIKTFFNQSHQKASCFKDNSTTRKKSFETFKCGAGKPRNLVFSLISFPSANYAYAKGGLTPKTRPQFRLQAATRLHEAGIISTYIEV